MEGRVQEVKLQTRTAVSTAKTIHLDWYAYPRAKRLFDIALAAIFLIVFSPLILLIGIGIRLHSPGGIFYRQVRIGKDGIPFTMLKFRSMRIGNDSQVHKQHVQRLIREDARPKDLGSRSLKMVRDPRITGLGKILRKLSLDEIPQFINVLRSEMSIVGPRPSMPYEYELYQDWHHGRLRVLPGITGLWQVIAHNQVSFSEMVRIDLDYIESMNLWLDLKIMIMTPIEMLRGKGGG
jgi:lipopolysaccharide/colanic/teichoic acid biosynthesis glycosyltransferase